MVSSLPVFRSVFWASIQAAILFSIAAICAGQLKDTLIRHESFPLIMSRVEGTLLLLIAIGLMFL